MSCVELTGKLRTKMQITYCTTDVGTREDVEHIG